MLHAACTVFMRYLNVLMCIFFRGSVNLHSAGALHHAVTCSYPELESGFSYFLITLKSCLQ